MNSKTIKHAISVLRQIKSECQEGVIKDYEYHKLCNLRTSRETGFAVILTLSAKFDYASCYLDVWRKRLDADDYVISVYRNQLRIRFNVMYSEDNQHDL